MKALRFILVISSFFTLHNLNAQVTSIPEQAKTNFASQYPTAESVEWDNDLVNVNVRFILNGEKMNAEYNNRGIWKSTLKDWTYDQLPEAVKDGFKKSKFAEREVTDVKVVYLPGNVEQYRLKAEKNDVQKKYLYFNQEGRLVRDANTI
jgi:hypothetical protein